MESEFAHLMSAIWESERALDALYRKAAGLKKLLRNPENTHSNAASVFPVEILGMIFEEVVGQSNARMGHQPSLLKPGRLPQEPHPVVRPELLVSHVSKYWRAVAIGTPSLWTHIRLYVRRSADLIDLYLARSRGLPLNVVFNQHFVCGANPHQAYAADYMRIAATIFNYMHICRRLEIRTNSPIPGLLEGLGCSHAPLLEEIVIYHPRMQEPVLSSSFPALTHLELGELISVSETMPNKALTSLTLSGLPVLGLPVASFLNLLRGLPSLSRLALLDEAVNFDGSHATDFVQLPSLRSLSLRPGPGASRIYLTGLMEIIITSALEELILDFTNVSSSRELCLFLRHLEREAPRFLSLRHITIDCPFEAFGITSALVYAAPNIETLSLSRYNVSSVLTYLTHDARWDAFPRLRVLQFESPQWDWDVVLSFLHKRKRMGRPLHRLQFDGFGGSKGEVLDNVFRNLLEACLAI